MSNPEGGSTPLSLTMNRIISFVTGDETSTSPLLFPLNACLWMLEITSFNARAQENALVYGKINFCTIDVCRDIKVIMIIKS